MNLRSTMEERWQAGFLLVGAIVIGLFSTGCSEHKPLHFAPNGILKVTYNPKDCTELLNGQFKCNEVIFTAAILDASQRK